MKIQRLFMGLAALTSVAALAPAALAACGDTSVAPASYQTGSDDAALIKVNLGAQGPIGLWAVNLMAGNTQIDWGYSEWHADGTEIMNSGGRAPASGNFCMGVWRQTGPNTYHLKHIALGYNPANGQFMNKILLTEDVTVAQGGESFSGPFSIDVYDPSGTTLQQHVGGTITGQRVEPN